MSIRPAPTAASGGPAPRAPRGFQGIAPVSDGNGETRTFAAGTAGGRMHGIGHPSHTSENPAAQPRLFRARGQMYLGPPGRPRAGEATHTFSGRAKKKGSSPESVGRRPVRRAGRDRWGPLLLCEVALAALRSGVSLRSTSRYEARAAAKSPPHMARRLARTPRLPVALSLTRAEKGAVPNGP